MKKLIIILFLIGGILMISPTDAFLKNTAENIVHRKNLTTGIVKVVNANKSFDVEIGNCGKICKGIFTLSPDPDLAVGDKTRVANLGGNKEAPILFAPTKVIAGYIFVYCWTSEHSYCIKSYTASGEYIGTFSVSELQDWNNVLAVDANNNVYCVNYNLLKCYDKNGSLLYQTSVMLSAVCIGPDGYIYTYEYIESEKRFAKRASGDSTIIESKTPARQAGTQAFIMDSNKNIYITRYTGTGTEKYNYSNTSPLSIVAENVNIYGYQRTFAIVNGVLAIGSRGSIEIKTAELDLSAYINESLDIATMGKPIGIGNIGNDFVLCGRNTAGDYAILGRYQSDGTKVWEVNIGTWADTTPYQVAAYPF